MIESPHGRYEPLDLPVYSLYSETRRPTREMLAGLDCLVIDLQDVGTRVYTFVWTMQQCLQRLRRREASPSSMLDRPNPLGGDCRRRAAAEPRLTRASSAARRFRCGTA